MREGLLDEIRGIARKTFESKFAELEKENREREEQMSTKEMCEAAKFQAEMTYRTIIKNRRIGVDATYDDPILDKRIEDLKRGFTEKYLELEEKYKKIKQRFRWYYTLLLYLLYSFL